MIALKRIYEEPNENDGYRVLVDRLWPRGVSKEKAALDEWLQEVGPSDELRQWFGHKPERFDEFRKRYLAELKTNSAIEQLQQIIQSHRVVTLLYSAHDADHNQAVVLRDYLNG